MGSIRRYFPGLLRFICLFSLVLFFNAALSAQNSVSMSPVALGAEITRLEKLAAASGASAQNARERYYAFSALVKLHLLSGNAEAALNACERALAAFPNDGRIMLEQGRLLISMGEYQRADHVLAALLAVESDRELVIQGRYIRAQLNAFSSGNTAPLAAMAEDPVYSGYLSGIYYTLWKLSGLTVWKTRLAAEFPQSPEAKIASGGMNPASTPLWLLYPGRGAPQTEPVLAAALSPAAAPPTPGAPPPIVSAPMSSTAPASSTAPVTAPAQVFLQTGLFSTEGNARVMTDVLKKAGFDTQIIARQLNGANYWAACVPAGSDMNATIRKLKDAGFESFPIR